MDTPQTDVVTMYQLVTNQYLPSEAAAGLMAIPLISKQRTAILGTLGLIKTASQAQAHPSTGLSRSRAEVKHEAAVKADIIRQLVLLFPPSDTAEVELKDSPLVTMGGDERTLLAYLQRILNYLPAISAADREEAGFDDKVAKVLAADLAQLNDTVGEVRQVINQTSGATDELTTLFTTLAAQGKRLDRMVKLQTLALPKAVEGYFKARRILHTAPQQRRRTLQGPAHFGTPTLVLDRSLVPLLSLTLSNRSARGYTLGFYLADTPTALPGPGQMVHIVTKTKPWHLASFDELGPPTARFLLVLLMEQGPDGRYYVQG